MQDITRHYDLLIDENNDPVRDPAPLRAYMDKWDGEALIGELALSGRESVLEIGVGTGRLALRVAPLCRAFCGIDLSPKTVERAGEHLASHENVRFLCGNLLTHDFDGERFDVIYSSLTFMHIGEKRRAIERVYGLLLPGGRFVLSIDKNQATSIDYGTRRLEIYPDTPSATHAHLTAVGFADIQMRETEFAYIFTAKKTE